MSMNDNPVALPAAPRLSHRQRRRSNSQGHGSNDPWIPFAQTALNLEKLQNLCQSEERLTQAGYIRQQLSNDQLKAKLRCKRCTARTSYRPQRPGKVRNHGSGKRREGLGKVGDGTAEVDQSDMEEKDQTTIEENGPKIICFYHPGPFIQQVCRTCTRKCSQRGCTGSTSHEFGDPNDPSHRLYWQFHETPASTASGGEPGLVGERKQRLAIAIDCEMGTAATGESELIRVSAVDMFTKETLLDQIVTPQAKMLHLNTRYSGVSWDDIRRAVASGNFLPSKKAAREALFRLVDRDTIIVAHGGSQDFSALRWIHPRIIDTFIVYHDHRKSVQEAEEAAQLACDEMEAELFNMTVSEVQQKREAQAEAEAEKLAAAERVGEVTETDGSREQKKNPASGRGPGGLSLKSLVKEHANMDIQMGDCGHDSVEDAFGCRELAIRFILNDTKQGD